MKTRALVALLGAASLVGLAWLGSIAHSWHKQDGPRACSICQAYRTPSTSPAAPVLVEPPADEASPATAPPAPRPQSALRITPVSRSPPC